MSESSDQDQTNDDEIMVGWKQQNSPLGSFGLTPVMRGKSDTERAMANMFKLAAEADNFEDCINNFEKAVKICRENGLELSPPPPPRQGGGTEGHQARMDASRIVITGILVFGVLAIVAWSLSLGNATAAAQYAAPVSGLAGIALGWLFTNQQFPSSSKKDEEIQ